MDTRDGRIYSQEEIKKMEKLLDLQQLGYFKPMHIPPTPTQLARTPPKVGRNEPCPCGSGKKFKKCCYRKESK